MQYVILFQTAKQIVLALHQRVTYEHFLPTIIGDQYMEDFGLRLLDNVSLTPYINLIII